MGGGRRVQGRSAARQMRYRQILNGGASTAESRGLCLDRWGIRSRYERAQKKYGGGVSPWAVVPLGVARRSAVHCPARARPHQRYLPSMISACTGPRDGPAPLFLRYLPVSLNFSTTRRNLVEVAPKVEIQALLAPKKPKRPFGPQKGTLSIPSFTSYPPAVASTRHHARVQESPQGAPPPPCSPRGFAALKSAFRTPPAGPLIFTGSGRSPAP